MTVQWQRPRILIFSQRNIFKNALFRGPLYEFENVISQVDSVDILAPNGNLSDRRYNFAKRVAYHAPILLNPAVPKIDAKRHYEVFFAICGAPTDLLILNAVSNLRNACTKSVCLLDEFWVKQMADHRHFLRALAEFDLVLLYYSQSVKALSQRIGRPCLFLPPAVDAMLFCPYPMPPKRVVDVYSIGRRSDITHQALLRLARQNHFFYLHDSIAGDQALSLMEHRALLAHVSKRSRFFVVNPALIDRRDKRGDQIEIGNRYFEGAASGTIMIGERPNSSEFDQLFDWPDVVIHLPYNSASLDIIEELDRDPDRQDNIRRRNVAEVLKRHDWVYRWEAILNAVGLPPLPEMVHRKNRLSELAQNVTISTNHNCASEHASLQS